MSPVTLKSALAIACFLAASVANGQPLLDRVIDRVEDELEGRSVEVQESLEPGYLGIIADDRQEQGRGVRILEVVPEGPAAAGGLMKNDLITAIDTRPIRSMDEMARILSAMPAGTKIIFTVRRGSTDKNVDVNVTLGTRPAPAQRRFEKFGRQPESAVPAAGAQRPKLGVRTLPVTAQAQQQFDLPSREGAMVVDVTPGSRAELAGIQVGDVITAVNGQNVRDPDILAELVVGAGPGEMTLNIVSNGQARQITVPAHGVGPAPVDRGRSPEVLPDTESEDSRFEAIERRLRELEDRIERIEQMLEVKT